MVRHHKASAVRPGTEVPGQTFSFCLLVSFVVAGIAFHGFFFANEYLWTAIIVFLGMTAMIYRQHDPKDAVWYLLLASAVVYASAIAWAVNRPEALHEAVKAAVAIPIYILGRHISAAQFKRLLQLMLIAASLSVVIGLSIQQFYEGRLAGTIGNANGYAIMMLVAVIWSQLFYKSDKAWPYLISQYACVVGLCLTQSRTVFLLWAASQIVLWVVNRRNQRDFEYRTWIVSLMGIVSAASYDLSPLLLVMSSVVSAGVILMSTRLHGNKLVFLLSGLGAMALVASVVAGFRLVEGFVSRWMTVGTQASEWQKRLIYYQDAITMAKDSPLLGFGGGGWTQLQYAYQTDVYFVKYVHSHVLQVLTDTGLVGLFLYIATIAVLLFRLCRHINFSSDSEQSMLWGRICSCCALVIHSCVDFTFSYVFFFGLLLILGNAGVPSADSLRERKYSKWRGGVLGGSSLVLAFCIAMILLSDYQLDKATAAARDNRPADAVKWLDRSMAIGFFDDQAHDQKAKMYYQGFLTSGNPDYLKVAAVENRKAVNGNPRQVWYRKLHSDILWAQGFRTESVNLLKEIADQHPFLLRLREEYEMKTRNADHK